LLQESARGEFKGRSLCGSAEGTYLKTTVDTEKIWTIWPGFRPPPQLLCDGRQVAHFHELLTGTGSLNKLFYVSFPPLSRHLAVLCVCFVQGKKKCFCATPNKHMFKETSVAALEERFAPCASEPYVFCNIQHSQFLRCLSLVDSWTPLGEFCWRAAGSSLLRHGTADERQP